MTLLASLTMPPLSNEERTVLKRVEGALARHPYMRADLGPCGPVTRELEDVLSVRLALLHTEGARPGHATLLTKLDAWEARLLEATRDEADGKRCRLRYETAKLLHPSPPMHHETSTARDALSARESRSRVTAAWERWHAAKSPRTVWSQRLAQNRDFFRHGAMLPLYWLRRRRIRRALPTSVLSVPTLRETYFAIEQVGPLVDNFAFRGAAKIPISTRVGLADIAFLYMQVADEFLDELAAACGGHLAADAIVRSSYRYTLDERPLVQLSLERLRRAGVDVEAWQTKFGVSLGALFEVLDDLASTIDRLLAQEGSDVVHATHLFLHHCFQTYLDEVDLCASAPGERADRLPLRASAWHFYRKNNMVMMLWLDLRARLLGLRPSDHASVIRRWGYLLASFQIFDDLKDVALDLGRQPSYPLQIAAQEFPAEQAWIERRFGLQRAAITRSEVREVSLRASQTVRQCMEWSRLIALAHFDNALLYAWDQRWKKSWTRRRGSFNPASDCPRRAGHAVDRLVRALLYTREGRPTAPVDDAQLAYALDATAYDGAWQIYLALFPNVRAMYRFATLRMWMSAEEKASAARRLLRRFPRARSNALVGLAESDVDHEISRDRLEAFAKLIEV